MTPRTIGHLVVMIAALGLIGVMIMYTLKNPDIAESPTGSGAIITEPPASPPDKFSAEVPPNRNSTSITNSPVNTVTKLEIKDTTVGTGTAVKSGDTVKIHYRGTLLDGTKFDSSYDRNQPFETKIGVGAVIQGWDEGLLGMKVGGKRTLTIPSDMAYGPSGRPPVIPPNSPLVFELELLEVK